MRIIHKWIIYFLDINEGIFIDQGTMTFPSWFSTHRLQTYPISISRVWFLEQKWQTSSQEKWLWIWVKNGSKIIHYNPIRCLGLITKHLIHLCSPQTSIFIGIWKKWQTSSNIIQLIITWLVVCIPTPLKNIWVR